MTFRTFSLNTAQNEVLAWVQDGCPAEVYGDGSHRVSARALHNRGLIVVRGYGPNWSTSLTDEGRYYLEHGSYPDEGQDHEADSAQRSSIADIRPPEDATTRRTTSRLFRGNAQDPYLPLGNQVRLSNSCLP